MLILLFEKIKKTLPQGYPAGSVHVRKSNLKRDKIMYVCLRLETFFIPVKSFNQINNIYYSCSEGPVSLS